MTTNAPLEVLLVTGLSGAGKTQTLRILKEIGYDTVDNLPLPLLNAFLSFEMHEGLRRCALGIDVRTRGFRPEDVIEWLKQRQRIPDTLTHLLFLDCADEALTRRYTETRSIHPLATQESPTHGIARERALLAPLREVADAVIDTSRNSVIDLKKQIITLFNGQDVARQLTVSLWSFGYKLGMPQGADVVLDVRFLRNPFWNDALRAHTGLCPDVAAYITQDPCYAPTVQQYRALIMHMVGMYLREGRAHLGIAIGCTGGKHRSVAIVCDLVRFLQCDTLNMPQVAFSVLHRELSEYLP